MALTKIKSSGIDSTTSLTTANLTVTANATVGNISATGFFYANGTAFIGGGGGGGTGYTGSVGYTGSIGYTGSKGSGASTSSATPPANPSVGDIWYDTTTDILYRYTSDGTTSAWLDITGSAVSVSATATTYKTMIYSMVFGAQ